MAAGGCLLHCDGTLGSTSFPDTGGFGHIFIANGGAQVDTAQKKFGTGSAKFVTTGDYISGDASSDFALGTGDFTIDFQLRLNATGSQYNIIDFRGNSGGPPGTDNFVIYLSTTAQITFYRTVNQIVDGGALSTATWYHIAVTRAAGTTRMFRDGTQVGSNYTDSNNYIIDTDAPTFGADGTGATALNGWLDEIRVIKGLAVWTSNFTPPSAPYADGSLVTPPLMAQIWM